jgi:hypothetical protein
MSHIPNSGLGQLADAFQEVTRGEPYYPVKKRGEARRLNPNWTAIAWLEAETLDRTEIIAVSTPYDGLRRVTTHGAAGIISRTTPGVRHSRPMFEIRNDRPNSNATSYYTHPCPNCSDLAYTRTCPEHGDPAKFEKPLPSMSLLSDMYNRLLADLPDGTVSLEGVFTRPMPVRSLLDGTW